MIDDLNERIGQNRDRLVKAFNDPDFQDELTAVRLEIEKHLTAFLASLPDQLNPQQRFFENVESRVKSPKSFLEKIYRKDYVVRWEPSDDMASNQALIASRLPDLLGFRINCFFCQDEEIIFNRLQDYCSQLPGFALKRTRVEKQKNGHAICKFSGKYNGRYSFEIQVKAIMHNIWGEVEHKTIYKDRAYDPNTEDKRSITEEVFNILQASDRQLVTLFSRKNDKKRLINALFYEVTHDKVQQAAKTEILGSHYNSFFHIFSDRQMRAAIESVVGQDLIGGTYQRRHIDAHGDEPHVQALKQRIQDEFLHFDLLCQYYICNQLFALDDYDDFLCYLASCQLRSVEIDLEPQEEDAFGEAYDELDGYIDDRQEQLYQDILASLEEHIKRRDMKDEKKGQPAELDARAERRG